MGEHGVPVLLSAPDARAFEGLGLLLGAFPLGG
jgi:hypothetical protein